MAGKALGIYLNDHLAGATAGVELSRRIAREHRASACARETQGLADEIDQDRRSLRALMDSLDVKPRHYKICGGWVAEKAARFKPNGRIHRRAGLSDLVEFETLRLGIQGKQQMWQALVPVAAETDRVDAPALERLIDRARSQMATVDALHDAAARTSLSRSGD
ncbi:hypothetical protein [Streptomyces formicae]|uniref:Uncharacterized protein n=1 Tax=Streptomyces formicae TaxID=1616117 RepID=A0ABY3WLE3_9ACTN|nr:hypothetical protein [Streptomyces formicae]UNM13442.1 hypothetical protein J4032_19870 [Streptomyces formicae]